MKWLGFREVAVKSLRVDAVEVKRRQVQQHVKDLAEDIREHGGEPIHAPTVREGTKELLCGRDRFAASVLNGVKKLWVHVVDCTDAEAKELELAENIYRRADNRAELIASLVKLREQHLRAADDARRAAGETVSAAPQDSPRARARKEVAKAAGITTSTVRSHEAHASEPVEVTQAQMSQGREITGSETASIELPAGFQAFGLEVSHEMRDRIDSTLVHLRDSEGDAKHVLRGLAEMEKLGGYTISAAHIQAIRERATALGHAIREAMPAGLCWYCKALPQLVANCNGCGGTGVVGRHAGDHVPEELKRIDVVHVAVNGEMVPLAAVAAGAPVAKAKKPGKAIKVDVVDETGVSHELTLEPDGLPAADEEVPF